MIHFTTREVFILVILFFITTTLLPDDKVLLSDSGVSRTLKTGTTLLTKAIGTLCWMSTESLLGNVAKFKKSSDVQVL